MRALTWIVPIALCFASAAHAALPPPGLAPRKRAFVLSNDASRERDARAVEKKLAQMGFQVTVASNVKNGDLMFALSNYVATLRPGDVGVFYYSGRVIRENDENYLVPIDFDEKPEANLASRAFKLSLCTKLMEEESKLQVGIIILDAPGIGLSIPFATGMEEAVKTGEYKGSIASLLAKLKVRTDAVVMSATPAAPPTPAGASTPPEAAAHAEAARAHYRESRYLQALEEFQKAYAIAPTPHLLYNIARCEEHLSKLEDALAHYEKFANETPDPRDRTEVLDRIAYLKNRLANPSPDAKHIEAGHAAFARGDYEGAVRAFKSAFDVRATPAALYNIARCYEKMQRYEMAIDSYRLYLSLYPQAPDRADIEDRIRSLRPEPPRKPELTVSSEPPSADIYLDDRNTGLQGRTNVRFSVLPGPHTLFLDLNGYEPVRHELVMPNAFLPELHFKLRPLENTGSLAITVHEEGARIFVDGAIIAVSPYRESRVLTAGRHEITVENNEKRAKKWVTIMRGVSTEVLFNLAEEEGEDED